MQFLAGVSGGDLLEELQELLVAVAGIADVGDLAGGGVQRGEQAGHAMPDVVMGLPLGDPRAHRQDQLCAFQGRRDPLDPQVLQELLSRADRPVITAQHRPGPLPARQYKPLHPALPVNPRHAPQRNGTR